MDPDSTEPTNQFVTIAGDGRVLFWDLRFKEMNQKAHSRRRGLKRDKDDLDEWKPLYQVPLEGLKPSGGMGELGLCKMVSAEKKLEWGWHLDIFLSFFSYLSIYRFLFLFFLFLFFLFFLLFSSSRHPSLINPLNPSNPFVLRDPLFF